MMLSLLHVLIIEKVSKFWKVILLSENKYFLLLSPIIVNMFARLMFDYHHYCFRITLIGYYGTNTNYRGLRPIQDSP